MIIGLVGAIATVFGALKRSRRVRRAFTLCLAALAVAGGCRPKNTGPAQPVEIAIPVSHPVVREVTDFVDFTGRTDAVESVSIRARVTGYLEKPLFPEGREVAKDQKLFIIDPRPYKAQCDQAVEQVAVNKASWDLAKATLVRDVAVNKQALGAVSAQQLDTDRATVAVAEAQYHAAEANLAVYKLNLDFTTVTSPIDGVVSRYYFTEGNLAIQDSTLLTTVVSVDTMFLYFDMDETTLVRIRKEIDSGRIKRYADRSQIPVYFGLQGEDGFPHEARYNFINNVVNPSTGSISTRAIFDNKKSPQGVRLFSPGMFVRVHLPIGQPHEALLVIDRAISTDQGNKYIYVMNKNTHKVEYRKVTTGPLQADGLRVVEKQDPAKSGEGLNADDWVVVGGLPQIKPQATIKPDEQPMPTLSGELPAESPGTAPAAAPKTTAAPSATGARAQGTGSPVSQGTGLK